MLLLQIVLPSRLYSVEDDTLYQMIAAVRSKYPLMVRDTTPAVMKCSLSRQGSGSTVHKYAGMSSPSFTFQHQPFVDIKIAMMEVDDVSHCTIAFLKPAIADQRHLD